jgi:hypothetical protein
MFGIFVPNFLARKQNLGIEAQIWLTIAANALRPTFHPICPTAPE